MDSGKKATGGGPWTHSGFVVLRTPLLPFDELAAWSAGLEARAAWERGNTPESIEAAWQSDINQLRRRLQALLERPEILHALFIASPSLDTGLEYWRSDPATKKGLQAERALVRYLERMAFRPTPFGVFSGCSVGRVVDEGQASFHLAPRRQYITSSRIDFDYLFALTEYLNRDPEVIRQLLYFPNSSLHRVGDSWHYIETRVAGLRRSHHLVEVEADDYLNEVLRRSAQGASIAELASAVQHVAPDGEIEPEEADAFIQELIRSGVLVSSLHPAVTGGSALDELVSQIDRLPSHPKTADILRQVQARIAGLDRTGIGADPAEYRTIASQLEALPAKVDINRLYQVDMIKPVERVVVPQSLFSEIAGGIEILRRLWPNPEGEAVRTFREAFQARYEGAMVPLLEAVDEECGITFGAAKQDGSPLVRGLKIGAGGPHRMGGELLPVHAVLLRKLLDTPGAAEIRLEPSDFPEDGFPRSVLPESFHVMVTIAARSAEALDSGDFNILLYGGSGPSGAALLGRFCHADEAMEACVRDHLRQEEALDPECVYAEIVHLPEGRIGNVLCRPVLREYELVYLGRSGAPVERQIPLSDLLLGIEDGKLVIFSRKLGKRVVPRMTNAHGYMNPQLAPVYRFLCHMQHNRGRAAFGFYWGPLDSRDFLPRVSIGRIVLAHARWRITRQELAGAVSETGSKRFVEIQELRRRRGLPRWLVLVEDDNTLPVDLDNPLSIEAFLQVAKRGTQTILREMYPAPDQLLVTGPEGCFCHELDVPIVAKTQAKAAVAAAGESRPTPAVLLAGASRTVRAFGPGSEWLYMKVYGGTGTLDSVLVTTVSPVLEQILESGAASRWFFIRYADPHNHLRIRFHGDPKRLTSEVLPLLQEAFAEPLASRVIWKIQVDTYERELERYGGIEATQAAEDLFFADSQAILEILKELRGDEGLDTRWKMALLGTDILLTDLGFGLAHKRTILERLRNSFRHEFQAGIPLIRDLGDRFRAERKKIESLVDPSLPQSPASAMARQVFERRSSRIQEVARRLRSLEKEGKLLLSVREIAVSYVHMHINRLVRSQARLHELALYDYLFRLYDAKHAREQKSAGAVVAAD